MKLLLTGATGKVGQNFLPRFLSEDMFSGWGVVALCNNRTIDPGDRVEVIRGSIADPACVSKAMAGVTHVLHMAAVKESPELAIDVSVKGMFVLLEEFRKCKSIRSDQRGLCRWSCLPAILGAGYGNFGTQGLCGLLCPDQGSGRGNAGAIPASIWSERLHIARALDHGKAAHAAFLGR